jgi:uncharacterized RmlC-like cupin family protein
MVGVTTVHCVVLAADNVLLREGLACVLDRSGFDAWVLAAGSALAASGQMRVPATAPSKRTLAAVTWKPQARLKTHGHNARRKPASACSGLAHHLP